MTRKTKKTRKLRKVLLTVCCAALLVCVTIGATVAYLTDSTQEIKNTFTVGNVDITLDETKGTPMSNDPNNHTFKMVPSQPIAKDPKVTVAADSEDCWLFVKIDESTNLGDFITYAVDNGWTELTTGSGVYYRSVLATDATRTFSVLANDQVTVKNTVTKEMMDEIEDGKATEPTLTFTAYVIQQAGFDTADTDDENAAAAWAQIQYDLSSTTVTTDPETTTEGEDA